MPIIEEKDIKCPDLIRAMDDADKIAIDRMGYLPGHLGRKPEGHGTSACAICGKIVTVRYSNAPLITNDSPFGPGKITGYDKMKTKRTVGVDSTKCSRE